MRSRRASAFLFLCLTWASISYAGSRGGSDYPCIAPLRVQADYAQLPLAFEANQGQVSGDVQFLARGHGYRLFLGRREFEVFLVAPATARSLANPTGQPGEPSSAAAFGGARLRMRLLGAQAAGRVQPMELLHGAVNYFRGQDPSTWRTGIPTFGKIYYHSVYPHIDLVFYGNQQSLEYDFVVGPGGNPSRIVLEFEGASHVEVDQSGDLVLHTPAGEFRHRRPVIYQWKQGRKLAVAGRYLLRSQPGEKHGKARSDNGAGGQVTFEIGPYDREAKLYIDPVLDYSTFLGGSGTDSGQGVAVDDTGSIYVTGWTLSTDFPTSVGAYDPSCGSNGQCNGAFYDVFVTKLNPAGTARVYSTYLGGSDNEQSWGIAVDSARRAHIMGYTRSTDFPTRNGLQSTNSGGADAFVAAFNPDGTLLYSTYIGGSKDEADIDGEVAVDGSGKVYVTGRTFSSDFPVRNAFQNPGTLDAFVAKLDPTLSGTASLLYSTALAVTMQ